MILQAVDQLIVCDFSTAAAPADIVPLCSAIQDLAFIGAARVLSEYVDKMDFTKMNKLSFIAVLRCLFPYRSRIDGYGRLLKYAKNNLDASDAEMCGLDSSGDIEANF